MDELDIPKPLACEDSSDVVPVAGVDLRIQPPVDGFYETYIKPIEDRMIRSVWRITRNSQDSEDAMQNALVLICKHRTRIEKHSSPQAFVLRICLDAACDVVRKRGRDRRRIQTDAVDDQIIDGATPPPEEIIRRELADEVVAAIRRLSRSQAIAIALRAFEDLPYEEIAAALNCTAATARKHVERARTSLRVVLAKHESQ